MSTAANIFKIAKQFHVSPGPRNRDEGDYSGQELREDFLVKLVGNAINKKQNLLIDLDGTNGYGTSFLEEAFGGLIRNNGYSLKDILKYISFKSEEEDYLIEDINEYLQEAEDETK